MRYIHGLNPYEPTASEHHVESMSDTYEMGLQDYKSIPIPETLPPLKKIANESIMGLQLCPYSARYLWTNNIRSSLLIQIHTWMVMEIQWPWWPLYSPTVTFPLNVWQKSFVIAHADSWTWLNQVSVHSLNKGHCVSMRTWTNNLKEGE